MRLKSKNELTQCLKNIDNAFGQVNKDFEKTSLGVRKAGRRMRTKLLLIMKQAKIARAIILKEQKLGELEVKEKN